ncbi:MAG TPA: hypothetical protein VGN97_10905 [Mesorhizobium sp.]|jgi:hypothetical protein|nr:hypothetical protein [Mesorhizobium sp.]
MSDAPDPETRILTFGPRRNAATVAEACIPRPPAPDAPRSPGNPFVIGVLRQGYYNAVAYINALTARET